MKKRALKIFVLLLLPLVFAVVSCSGAMSGGCSPIFPVPAGCGNMDLPNLQLPPGPPVGIHVLLPKFECAQEPTETRCCPPGNDPSTPLDEQACCEAFMSIMAARPESERNLFPPPPFSPEEAAQYAAACTVPGPGEALPPMFTVRLRCANEEDKIASCSTEDTDCCFSVTKTAQPTPIVGELILAEGTTAPAGLTKEQALTNLQTGSVVWSQTRGRPFGVNAPPPGVALSGTTVIKTATRANFTDPLDTTLQGNLDIAFGGTAVGEAIETNEVVVCGLALNGANQFCATAQLYNALQAKGGCGGCALGGTPHEALGNLLLAMALTSIPFLIYRRLTRSRVRVVRKR